MESTLPAAATPSRRRSCPATHCASAGSGWSYAARCSSPCSAATKRRCNHVTQHQVKPPWEVGCRGGSACVTQSARCMGWSHRNSHFALLKVEQLTLQLCHLTTVPQHQKRNHNNRASTWRAGRRAAGGAEPAAPGLSRWSRCRGGSASAAGRSWRTRGAAARWVCLSARPRQSHSRCLRRCAQAGAAVSREPGGGYHGAVRAWSQGC